MQEVYMTAINPGIDNVDGVDHFIVVQELQSKFRPEDEINWISYREFNDITIDIDFH
jgi:hypothetical protein